MCGARHSQVATLVERRSRYLMLVRLDNKQTDTVVTAISRSMRRLPKQLRSTLTWDRGLEFAAHKDFTVATNCAVYFCDPHSPWQNGTNENTNRLLRQYLPRTVDFRQLTQAELNRIARRLNTRPRKTLDFATPAAMLSHGIGEIPDELRPEAPQRHQQGV